MNVTIIDDVVLENEEEFDVTLTRTTGLDTRITLDPVDGVVQIIDDDGRPKPLSHNVFISLSLSQWLWWVWREHCTVCQRKWVWSQCVLWCMNQPLNVQLHSPLTLNSQPKMTLLVCHSHSVIRTVLSLTPCSVNYGL